MDFFFIFRWTKFFFLLVKMDKILGEKKFGTERYLAVKNLEPGVLGKLISIWTFKVVEDRGETEQVHLWLNSERIRGDLWSKIWIFDQILPHVLFQFLGKYWTEKCFQVGSKGWNYMVGGGIRWGVSTQKCHTNLK